MARKLGLKLDSYRRHLYRTACVSRRLNAAEFSSFMRGLVLARDGDLAESRNCENVNAEIAIQLASKINRHYLIWKLFFRVK